MADIGNTPSEDITKLKDEESRRCVQHCKACPLLPISCFAAGFSCTSYSRLNKEAKKNATAMQRANEGDPDVTLTVLFFQRVFLSVRMFEELL